MAAGTHAKSRHSTIAGASAAEDSTITGHHTFIAVKNRSTTPGQELHFRNAGTAATVGGNGNDVVVAGESLVIPASNVSGSEVVSRISAGAGLPYSVRGFFEYTMPTFVRNLGRSRRLLVQ